jgi:thiopurine S-methyltransferase
MEPTFWLDRWQRADTGFHQKTVHDLLAKHWPALGVASGAEVFVPLCGKSSDMAWLADQGLRVKGIELSELALASFFAERGLEPAKETSGEHTIWRAGPYELWCGDYFSLPSTVTAHAAAAFDRAALVAMPPRMQKAYAEKLAELLPAGSSTLLVSLDFDGSKMPGPPFPISDREIQELFGAAFRIETLERRDGLEMSQNLKQRGLTALDEAAYRLVRL